MAIQASHTALLMDVRREIMGFHSKRAGRVSLNRVGCPVFPVIVVLVPAVIIATHVVAVMAAQALAVCRFDKAVIQQRALRKAQVTGCATRSVTGSVIGIALGIDVAPEAAPSQPST